VLSKVATLGSCVATSAESSPALGGQKPGISAMHNMQLDAAKNRRRLQTGSLYNLQAIGEC